LELNYLLLLEHGREEKDTQIVARKSEEKSWMEPSALEGIIILK
jgi:hypothetical protein